MIRAISFDFHNTLVQCDAWFQHEVHTLASDAIRYLAGSSDDSCVRGLLGSRGESVLPEADALYADIRSEAKASGREVSAKLGLRRVLVEQLGLEIGGGALDDALHEMQRAWLTDIAPMPGVPEIVAQLAERWPLVVVSNAIYPPFLEWSLTKLGLRGYFGPVITSAGAGYYKSDRRIYDAALHALGDLEPRSVVHIGDSYQYDVIGAAAAGLRTIWYNPGGKPRPDGATVQPEAEIAEMGELVQVIRRL